MNARFWVWWNDGWVKLTLRPGEVVHLRTAGPTDEGYYYIDEVYENDGNELWCDYESGGSDCNGPLTRHAMSVCHLVDLEPCTEPQSPPWKHIKSWQRDAYAEAAGY